MSEITQFTIFVLWLLSFPMEGFLLQDVGSRHALLFFLIPHFLALTATGLFADGVFFSRVSWLGTFLTMIVTMLFPHFPGKAPLLLVLAGFLSAPMAIRSCMKLREHPSPTKAAALGLVAANLLLCLFTSIDLNAVLKFQILSILLIFPLQASPKDSEPSPLEGFLPFLPFVFAFQVVSGLMYGYLFPKYSSFGFLPGSELVFYIIAVLAGGLLSGMRKDLLLVAGIFISMIAFSFLQIKNALFINLSMFAMQFAVGFVDLFLLYLMLFYGGTVRVFGIGLGTLCLGIACGKYVTLLAADYLPPVVAVGNLVLTASILTLYFVKRKKMSLSALEGAELSGSKSIPAGSGKDPVSEVDELQVLLPPGLRKRFSDQERSVLALVIRGATYRETARKLGISESTVKTYMKRMCEKIGVAGKEELVEIIVSTPSATAQSNEDSAVPF